MVTETSTLLVMFCLMVAPNDCSLQPSGRGNDEDSHKQVKSMIRSSDTCFQ